MSSREGVGYSKRICLGLAISGTIGIALLYGIRRLKSPARSTQKPSTTAKKSSAELETKSEDSESTKTEEQEKIQPDSVAKNDDTVKVPDIPVSSKTSSDEIKPSTADITLTKNQIQRPEENRTNPISEPVNVISEDKKTNKPEVKPDIGLVKEPAKKPAKEPDMGPAKEPAKKPTKEPDMGPAKEPVESLVPDKVTREEIETQTLIKVNVESNVNPDTKEEPTSFEVVEKENDENLEKENGKSEEKEEEGGSNSTQGALSVSSWADIVDDDDASKNGNEESMPDEPDNNISSQLPETKVLDEPTKGQIEGQKEGQIKSQLEADVKETSASVQ